ncbi:MAG: sugar phosphate isomerase/epimerase family protein [Candidatus Hodarchaeales archaeon]|jgi:sugar phosphate isomerase/epimerase
MDLSVSTATFYFRPFRESLEIITEAGFKFIELAVFWENEIWTMAQHLRNLAAKDIVKLTEEFNLKISTIHDPSGVVPDQNTSPQAIISPNLTLLLDELPESPKCIVFHTPHLKGKKDLFWWKEFSEKYVSYLDYFTEKRKDIILTIENMPTFKEYYVPLLTPEDYIDFVLSTNLGITLDTTHFAQIGIDITKAVQVLGNKVRTIHLSDFANGKPHVFLGDGILNWESFFRELDYSQLHSITLECSMSSSSKDSKNMTKDELISRLTESKSQLERLMNRFF